MKSLNTFRILLASFLFVITEQIGADYTLDDSFWNDDSPAGEVERLLKEYRQNQELVRRIGSHYYQIIYPVQLRHHEKMGISTREINAQRQSPQRGYDSNYPGSSGGGGRGRSRTGKHFHRTSLLIKAFNHKFRLDLELNTQLLAPNIQQKHFLPSGYPQDSHREIEHCYYHGTVKDYPGASAAFHTCNGVSGVIHVGNETFVIHPFYGGDLSKHPHVIFEARTKSNKGCANSGNLNWHMKPPPRNRKNLPGLVEHLEQLDPNGAGRYRRDVREATKYIETAIVIDKAMFDKRNGSTRAEVVHDAIQVANIADLYFRTLNTRVSVVYIETWQGQNQAHIDGGKDISKAISSFNDYTSRKLFKIDKDTTQLLTGETFSGGEAGMSVPETVCTAKAVGISVDINTYEPHLLAGTMAHMIGHNIGMGHDDNREECFCRDWHGCIMAQQIVGLENVQPYKFSECSRSDYIDALRIGHGLCLLNKPNELEVRRNCGNGIVEDGEECDCGSFDQCASDMCCDPITCKLKKESECATGACCERCQLKPAGVVCRKETNECDLPETCTGDSGICPPDVYKKNGNPCGSNVTGTQNGYCFNGVCPTLTQQCERIWGYGAASADKQCFEQFNSKGSINGHCGTDQSGNYVKCEPENVQCGSLQCRDGDKQPVSERSDLLFSRTIISIKGSEYECKATSGVNAEGSDIPNHGLVRDGTPCGDNLVCINQTCVSIFPHIDQTKCPTNQINTECSGHGVCTNVNRCYCSSGWGGPDCSISVPITTTPTTTSEIIPTQSHNMEKIEKTYENYHGSNTVFLVGILMSVVGGVFITFALMALCYRSVVVQRFTICLRRKSTRLKYDPPYIKKPIAKYPGQTALANHRNAEEVSLDGSNKLVYGNIAPYNRDPNVQMRRMTETGSEDDPTPAGNATVSDVERTLKSLNGYHEDILEALKAAAAQRSSGNTPSGSISEEMIRKTLQDCNVTYAEPKRTSSKNSSRENVCDNIPQHMLMDGSQASTLLRQHSHHQALQSQIAGQDDEDTPSVGPLRIRNLEDLIRQLEQHSSRHMSPNGSEDIRMSETEADRHYRIDSSAACSESSHDSNQQLAQQQKTATILPTFGSRCRPQEENRFVYGRYRHPPANRHQPHSPHSFAHHSHAHHGHTHTGHSSHHSSHTHLHQDEDGIYETAESHGNFDGNRDTPESESDELFQAQRQLARWASEDVVSVVVMDPNVVNSGVMQQMGTNPNAGPNMHHADNNITTPLNINTAMGHKGRDYYPSPASTETESSENVMQMPPPRRDTMLEYQNGGQGVLETSEGYPEYKH
ncbi:disintegrin and metalloproteinase domain-containing protein 22 isoform X2 [Culicoides brevitarsis]|uniref:disintegrin and metalloproteinase domain-containing protein 22 isoform X2 n=1 Tax=Culicoides brevitarsis TaxID=469753 RepID=UPI00307B3B94